MLKRRVSAACENVPLILFFLVALDCTKARMRLEIGIEIGLDFDQSKQSLLNLRSVFFLLIGQNPIHSQSLV